MALSKIRNDSLADTAVHGRRNIIINGAMQVAQRGTSTSGKTGGVSFNSCDRMSFSISSCGTWTVSQDSNAPDGFANSYKVLCTTAKASLAASNYVIPLNYVIEGQDLQQLAFGTSSAKKMTMSFWVKSNKTGSGSVEFLQQDNSGKLFTGTYTINSADTWEYKTISIPADTAGVINDDTGHGIQIQFWGNSGSNFTGGSAGSTWATISNPNRNPNNLGIGGAVNDYWQITGLQLEVSDTATPFEHRSYGEELALCERYYQRYSANGSGNGAVAVFADWSGTNAYMPYSFKSKFRAFPTFYVSDKAHFNAFQSGESSSLTNFTANVVTLDHCEFVIQDSTAIDSQGQAGWLRFHDTGAWFAFDAEL